MCLQKKENILVLIGNGFDLAHGLKTKYEDFIKTNKIFKQKYSIFKTEKDEWNAIEGSYQDILIELMNARTWTDVTEIVEDIIDNYGFNEYGDIDYYGYKSEIYSEEYKQIEECIKLLEDFEYDFNLYLLRECSEEKINEKIVNPNIKNILEKADLVLSFNYTETAEILYENKKIFHVHGKLKDKIHMGSGALDEAKGSQLDINYPTSDKFGKDKYAFQELMRYYEYDENGERHENQIIKRFFDGVVESSTNREKQLFDLLDCKSKDSLTSRKKVIDKLIATHYDEVYIVGHSLGLVDKKIFDSINKDAKFICFYHGDKDILYKKNIINVLGWNCDLIDDKELFNI